MGQKCKGGCNRYVDEYYILQNGEIYCYDCWKRATFFLEEHTRREISIYLTRFNDINNEIDILKDEISPYMDNEKRYEINSRIERLEKQEKKLHRPPIDYKSRFDNAIFYNKQEAIKHEKWEKEEYERKQNQEKAETRKKTEELYIKSKNQNFGNNISIAKERLTEIIEFFKKNTYENNIKVLELLNKKYDWDFNSKETFTSSLADYDKSKLEFEQLRNTTINIANHLNKLIIGNLKETKEYNFIFKVYQIENLMARVNELLKEDTYKGALEVINIFDKNYSWKTAKGSVYLASLRNFHIKLKSEIENEIKQENENKKKKLLLQQREEEKEQRRQEIGSLSDILCK